MLCPVCGHDNDDRDSHCRECAAALRSAEDEILTNRDVLGDLNFGSAPAALPATPSPPPKPAKPPPQPAGTVAKRPADQSRSKPALRQTPDKPRAESQATVRRSVRSETRSTRLEELGDATFRGSINETYVSGTGRNPKRTIRVKDQNGRTTTYHSVAEMPADARKLYEALSRNKGLSLPIHELADRPRTVASVGKPAPPHTRRRRSPLRSPAGVSVEQVGDALRLTRRWYQINTILVSFVAVPFLLWVGSNMLSGGLNCFGMIPTLIALALGYNLLCTLINTTVIEVSDALVTIRHGPLPWLGNKDILAGELDQLFVDERITSGKHGRQYRYILRAVKTDGSRIRLLPEIRDPQQALFMEKTIEDRLGIVDRPVRGEYGEI